MSKLNTLLAPVLLFAGCDAIPVPSLVPAATTEWSQAITTSAVMLIETSQPEPTSESPAAQTELTGKVIGISDGYTVDILTAEKTRIRIRLNGIDAPETGQPFGRNAKQFISDKIGGQMVCVVSHGEDRYGRTIGDVYAEDSLVKLEIVKTGLAWHYVKYAPDDKTLAAAEAEARAGKMGLWSDRWHVAPRDWRKLSKAERDKLR